MHHAVNPHPRRSVGTTLQRHKPVLVDDLANLVVTLALNDLLVDDAALAWVTATHLRNLILHVAKIGGEEAGADTEDFDAISLELVVPVNHKHVEGGLGAAVSDGLEIDLLWPASLERWSWEVGALVGDGHVGKAGDEEEAWLRALEEKWHEFVAGHVCAGNVGVVGFVEGVTEAHFALDPFHVEGGA